MRPDREQGVALLTMLLLVAVMSVLAVAVLDDIRFAIRRTSNAQSVGQAQWYALGAETLAREQIARLSAFDPARTPGGWEGQARIFPIDGGQVSARLDDAGNCFNLNSVVIGAPEYWLRNETGLRQYRALLEAVGLPERTAVELSEALADWIDTDAGRNLAGAEDGAYDRYRTSGALLSEASELRALRGYDAAVYERFRPFVCALPGAELSPLNVNTLTPEQGVLLTMLSDGRLTPGQARALIEARPAGGWQSLDAFWAQVPPAVRPSDAALSQASLRTRYYGLTAQVSFADGEAFMTALLEDPGGGPVRVRARRWTPDE